MKLKTIIMIVFILTALGCSIGGTFYYYLNSKAILQEEVQHHLTTTAQSRAYHVETFVNEKKLAVEQLAASSVIRNLLTAEKNSLDYKTALMDVNERFDLTMKVQDAYYEVFLLDSYGKVAATTNVNERIGEDFSDDLNFIQAKEKTYLSDLSYDDEFGVLGFVIAANIKETLSGEFLGVLVVRLNKWMFDYITVDRTGLGSTGEVYMINDDMLMITPSRFVKNAVLNQKVDTDIARTCFNEKNKENVAGQRATGFLLGKDYRDVDTASAYTFITDLNYCIIVEMDEDEVLGALRKELLITALELIISITALVGIIGIVVGRYLTGSIKDVTDKIANISKGNLEMQLEKSGITEVQNLIDSLNRILVSLKLAVKKVGIRKEEIGLGEAIEAKEEAEKKYQALFELAVDAIFIADPETKNIMDCNKAAQKLTGYTKKELLSMKAEQLHPKELLKKTMEDFKKHAAGHIKLVKTVVLTKNKKRVPVSINSSIITIKGKKYLQGIFRRI